MTLDEQIREFQKDQRLLVDGIVGKKTKSAAFKKASEDQSVIKWFNDLKTMHPDIKETSPQEFMANDQSGYDYTKAIILGQLPGMDPDTGQLHWSDIGKTDKYWKSQLIKHMFPAVRRQEGPAKYDKAKNIDTRDGTIRNSIRNNYDRWKKKYPEQNGSDFVTFMGNEGGPNWNDPDSIRKGATGWAKPGVSNDPTKLNENWIPGVKKIMKQNLKGEYEYWHDKNLLMNQLPSPVNNGLLV